MERNSYIFIKEMHMKMSSGKWRPACLGLNVLTHWGRVTHICVSELTIIDSDNGFLPGRRKAVIWTNSGILLIRTSGTKFSEISSKIRTFSFRKLHSKISFAKWRPFCLGLNVFIIGKTSYTRHKPELRKWLSIVFILLDIAMDIYSGSLSISMSALLVTRS